MIVYTAYLLKMYYQIIVLSTLKPVEWITDFSVILTVNIHDIYKKTSTIQTVILVTFKALFADVVCCLVCTTGLHMLHFNVCMYI